jgi:hypothetical protein
MAADRQHCHQSFAALAECTPIFESLIACRKETLAPEKHNKMAINSAVISQRVTPPADRSGVAVSQEEKQMIIRDLNLAI